MSNQREQLQIDLQRIADHQYQLDEGEELQDYVPLLLQYIGDPQPELRDELIYPTFWNWIGKKQLFSEAELREMLSVLLDDGHLFYQIGSEEDPAVFTRTFSVLIVALILHQHRKRPFIDQQAFIQLKDALIRYYEQEKDLRGYVAEGGWAHAAAHGADALVELVQCEESDAAVQLEVLSAIKGMLYNDRHIFNADEDERMACILDAQITHHLLPQQVIAEWIGQLEECSSWPMSLNSFIAKVNTKKFLRCLYFRWLPGERGADLLDALLKAEAKLNEFLK